MKLAQMEQRRDTDIHKLKKNFILEQKKTQQVIDKMDQMKLELKMLESNDSSVASIWKKKCMDIFEVCQTMKQENEELRSRCKELIELYISLENDVAAAFTDGAQFLRTVCEHSWHVQCRAGFPDAKIREIEPHKLVGQQ